MFESSRERLILQGCLARDRDAWEHFLDEYLPSLYHVVFSVESHMRLHSFQSGLDYEDLLASVITRFIENDFALVRKFRGECNLETYIIIIARRTAIDISKSIMNRKKNVINLENLGEPIATSGICATDQVETVLKKLKPLEREAVQLHYLEGYSLLEVGKQLKITATSLASILLRARKKIQNSHQK